MRGISGTSLNHRDGFNEMIADCKAGKIDMIITKSVSRFARNIVDCISMVQKLAALSPPVGIFFETESIFHSKMSHQWRFHFKQRWHKRNLTPKVDVWNSLLE